MITTPGECSGCGEKIKRMWIQDGYSPASTIYVSDRAGFVVTCPTCYEPMEPLHDDHTR